MTNPLLEKGSSRASDKQHLLDVYEKIMLVRLSEEKIRAEYSKDEMKTPVHLGIGAEAIAAGVWSCVPSGTKAFGTYRNHAIYLTATDDVEGFFGELYGKETGPGKGKAGSMHLCLPEKGLIATSAVVATTIPVAVGAAFANKYRKSDDLVVVFFGDGAIEEGVFWESINFACHKKLRVLLVCEDNDLAIHTAIVHRQGFRSIPEVVSGFDCHVASGDGHDVLAVQKLTNSLLLRMEEDPKPAFLHLKYFRFLEHVGPAEDFNAGYRLRPPSDELERLDPVTFLEKKLLADGVAPADLNAIKKRLQTRIDKSVELAQKAAFPSAAELYKDVLL